MTEPVAERNQQRIVIGIAVVCRQFQKRMVTCGVIVKVCVGENDDRFSCRVISRHNALIRIPQPVHLACVIANIGKIQGSGAAELNLRTEAELFYVWASVDSGLVLGPGYRVDTTTMIRTKGIHY